MKKNTKQKIIDLAVDLFNKEGFAAISLQELADELGMSRGNLTYHFKDKKALLQGITEQLWSCLLYTSPSPRDATLSRMPSSA